MNTEAAVKRMRSIFFHLPLLAAATAASAQTAPPRVVPGSSAAYLYFPASTNSRSVLSVVKQGTFKSYAITYQLNDNAPEVLCAIGEESCEVSLAAGLVTLAVEGYYGTGSNAKILAAGWAGDCAATAAASCKLSITSGANQFVRISTACDGSAYSLVQMGTSEGLCIASYQGEYLVAAHKDIVSGRRPKNVKATWANTTTTDGRENMPVLLSNMSGSQTVSSAHWCNGLSVGGRTGWYLPATGELSAIGPTPAAAILGTYYASNSASAKKNNRITYAANKAPSSSSSAYNTSSDYSTLCMTRVTPAL